MSEPQDPTSAPTDNHVDDRVRHIEIGGCRLRVEALDGPYKPNDSSDRVRYLEKRVERLCDQAGVSDYYAREYLKRAEAAETRVKELETQVKELQDQIDAIVKNNYNNNLNAARSLTDARDRAEIAEARIKVLKTELNLSETALEEATDRHALEIAKLQSYLSAAQTRNINLVHEKSYLRSTAKLNEPRPDGVHVDANRRLMMADTIGKLTSILANMKTVSEDPRVRDSKSVLSWFDRRIDEALKHINAFNQSSLVAVAVGETPVSSETQSRPDDDSRFMYT